MTKLSIQEMMAVTLNFGNATSDLETAKSIEITNCRWLGKFRHNFPRPILVTFAKRDDKESFLSKKWQLPPDIYVNE